MPAAQAADVDEFIDKFEPPIAKLLRAARTKLRKLFPRGYELVYDNYNALGVGYSYKDKASGVVMSVVAYPRWVSVFFFNGARLKDPGKLLKGSGNRVRHIVLESARDLDLPAVKKLIKQSMQPYDEHFAVVPKRTTIVKLVLAKQRPRRPQSKLLP